MPEGTQGSGGASSSRTVIDLDADPSLEVPKETQGFMARVDAQRAKGPMPRIDLDDSVEIDDVPEAVIRPRRNTKEEATSLRHLLLRDRKSPHCPICQEVVVSRGERGGRAGRRWIVVNLCCRWCAR